MRCFNVVFSWWIFDMIENEMRMDESGCETMILYMPVKGGRQPTTLGRRWDVKYLKSSCDTNWKSYSRTRVACVVRIESKLGSMWQIFHAGNLRNDDLISYLSCRSRSTCFIYTRKILNDTKIFVFNAFKMAHSTALTQRERELTILLTYSLVDNSISSDFHHHIKWEWMKWKLILQM